MYCDSLIFLPDQSLIQPIPTTQVVHIVLTVSQYYANSLCSTNVTNMLNWYHYYAPL